MQQGTGIYGEPEQPSIFQNLFGTPLRAQMTFQKASFAKHILSYKMFGDMAQGKGFKWSGIVGFRGIALGEGAFGSTLSKSFSPHNAGVGIARGFSETAGDNFRKFGLFGYDEASKTGGVLNGMNNKISGFLGRFFGGGIVEASKFENITGLKGVKSRTAKKMYSRSSLMRANIEHFTNVSHDTISKRAYSLWESAGRTGSETEHWGAAVSALRKEGIHAAKSNISKMLTFRRLATIGKIGTWVGIADMAFDIGSLAGSLTARGLGAAADKLENSLSSVVNRRHEFGGKVGIGFYSSRSGTERQRALSAIGNGYGADAGMGNEAAYQHVDSSW